MAMKALLAVIAFGAMMSGRVEGLQGGQREDSAVIGVWEGESKCMIAGSPCHDEHVIYEIARDEKAGGQKIDAYKIVNREKLFMGTLRCQYHAEKKNLSCSGGNPRMKSVWEYFVSGDTIEGTLVIGDERALYRKINLKRKGGKA
jgi:hypothetical protein